MSSATQGPYVSDFVFLLKANSENLESFCVLPKVTSLRKDKILFEAQVVRLQRPHFFFFFTRQDAALTEGACLNEEPLLADPGHWQACLLWRVGAVDTCSRGSADAAVGQQGSGAAILDDYLEPLLCKTWR